jgi:hypothetical protein
MGCEKIITRLIAIGKGATPGKGCMHMKKTAPLIGLVFCAVFCLVATVQFACAEVDLKIIKRINVKEKQLDVAASADGEFIFILVPGEVLVYSIPNESVTDRIQIDEAFDSMTYSAKNNTLILGSSAGRALSIIQVERVYNIVLSGLPFKGPADAPVAIAVFEDYQ